MAEYHVLNLGAGVQSTALYLLAREGRIPCDVAIFADTGEEPAAVYRHLAWLFSLGKPPIWVRTAGRLGDDLQQGRVPHPVPRSACVFCPFHTNREWAELRRSDPTGWARAVAIDEALRQEGNVVNRGMDQKLYLHRTCLPLASIDFDALAPEALDPMTTGECDGMCGV